MVFTFQTQIQRKKSLRRNNFFLQKRDIQRKKAPVSELKSGTGAIYFGYETKFFSVFFTPTEPSITSWRQQRWSRVCPEWPSTLTTAQWRVSGNPQERTILWQAIYKPGRSRFHDRELYHLLQQPPRTAQPGCADTDGKTRKLSHGGITKPQKLSGQLSWHFLRSHGTAVPCILKRLPVTKPATGSVKNLYFISLSTWRGAVQRGKTVGILGVAFIETGKFHASRTAAALRFYGSWRFFSFFHFAKDIFVAPA